LEELCERGCSNVRAVNERKKVKVGGGERREERGGGLGF